MENIFAKRRARLLQQTRLRIHRKHGAVGRKARLQVYSNARRQLAAKGGRTVQNGLGLRSATKSQMRRA